MPDTVIAVVSRANLNGMLAAYHRSGYGRVVRVMDPDRAPVADQLIRARVQVRTYVRCPDESVIVCIHAPERTSAAAAIAVATGASDVEFALRLGGANDGPPPGILQTAQDRRLRRATAKAASFANCSESPIQAD